MHHVNHYLCVLRSRSASKAENRSALARDLERTAAVASNRANSTVSMVGCAQDSMVGCAQDSISRPIYGVLTQGDTDYGTHP
eukprot:1159548-Pelagomonas_calceolata.AAC.4